MNIFVTTTLVIISAICSITSSVEASSSSITSNTPVCGAAFNEGWKVGWNAGWRHVKGMYSTPIIHPVPPVPPVGQNDFQGGYNAGFVAGMEAAKN